MSEAEIAARVYKRLTGRISTHKDDDSWGALFWGSAAADTTRELGRAVSMHIDASASCFITCPTMPRFKYITIYPDGTVVGDL